MSWDRIRGHDTLVTAFQYATRRGRLAHAYLFTGPPGIGKRLFAIELAKALLCHANQPETLAACDHCPSCSQVEARSHPDFVLAGRPEDKHEWPIELMREVLHSFALRSASGKGRVAIFDDADDFNEESANCFLKTLEEPPPRSVLILIGTGPERQLPTILSRCQVVRFAPLPESLVAEFLRAQGIEDGPTVQRLARLSGGSPGQAKALSDPALWEFRATFVAAFLKSPVDSVSLARAWWEFVEEAGKESAARRERASLVLRLMVEFLADVLRVQSGGEPRFDDPSERKILETVAQRTDVDRLLAALERCLDADMHVDRRVQLELALEGLVDQLGEKLKG